MAKYNQGQFKPQNPQKYKGDHTNIVYRSGWEFVLMRRLDTEANVIWWSSEETVVGYRSPVDRKPHRYFVDFTVRVKQADGTEKTLLIEIKPLAQTKPPVLKENAKVTRAYKKQVITYAINDAKWRAAREYAKDRGYEFKIMTEVELGL